MISEIAAGDVTAMSRYAGNFLLILLRAGIFLSLLPVIGAKQLPAQFRLGLAVFISLLLTPVINVPVAEYSIALLVLKEMIVAAALGLTVRFVFLAVNMAGTFMSYAMGLSMARVFNPEVGQDTLVAEVYGIFTMLIFLSLDAHHDLIYVFVKSFELLPAGHFRPEPLLPEIVSMGTGLFALALKISAPVMVGLLIVHLLSGFLYKVAPQMNIFFITMPLNILLGIVLMLLTIPVFEHVLGISFSDLRAEMSRLIITTRG
ncbi:MAG: flagellar biosynthetic protein FliR [Nitrospiraceae bacterium]|nr:MAG: flagellar biosynthetic protein FliR [Nitrospiraceae bacterium]